MMAKKRRLRFSPLRLSVSMLLLIGMFFMWKEIYGQVNTTFTQLKERTAMRTTSKELDEQIEELQKEKRKLENGDYIEIYARGEYQITKEGEQIFILPRFDRWSTEKTEE